MSPADEAVTARRKAPPEPLPPGGDGDPRRFGAILPDGIARRLGPWLGLIALCLALYLPGLTTLPPVDRDEARFAQATRQMLETGDWIRLRYQGEARNKKPVGIYWAQAATASLFGGAEAPVWAFRLPSLLAMTGAVLMLYGLGRRLFEPRTAFLGASLLAASLIAVVEAHLAKTDAALLAATVAAQGALGVIYLRARGGLPAGWLLPLALWTALGAGVLLKGPVLPMITALTMLALAVADRSGGWLRATRPLPGLALAALIVAPWLVAISRATGGAFLTEAVGNDLLPKLIGGQESHGAWPGTYLALVMLTLFPASLQLAPALRDAWRRRLLPAERFCLAWVGPSWLVFELVPTKLPHYVMPLYPALALLIAHAAVRAVEAVPPSRGARALQLVWLVLGLALAGAAVALPVLLERRVDWIGAVPALGALAVLAIAARRAWRGESMRAAGIAVAGAGLLFATILGTVLPRLPSLWLSAAAAGSVAAHRADASVPVASAGYAEPSLVFLVGTATLLTTGPGAAEFLAAHPTGLVLVSSDQEAGFAERARALGVTPQPLDQRSGYNYSRGRRMSLTLYRRG